MRRLRDRLGDERGLTLIEMLVAAIVLAVGIGAAITVLIHSGHASSAAERNTTGVDQAQKVIENARSLPYDQVGLTGTGWTSAGLGATDPTTRVSGSNFTPVTGAGSEALVAPGANGVTSPGITPYSVQTIGSGASAVTARIYTFVTWRNESCGAVSGTLLSLVGGSGGSASTLSGLSTLLNNSALKSSLAGLSTNINGAVSNLNGLLSNLVGTLLGAATGIIAKGNDLGPTVTGVQNSITSTSNSLTTTSTVLTNVGNINLCNVDLSVLSNVKSQLATLTSLINSGSLTSALNSLTALGNVSNLFNQAANCGLLCALGSLLGTVNNALASGTNGESVLKGQIAALTGPSGFLTQTTTALTSLNSSIASLSSSASNSNPKSSKRVTVAVVLDPAGKVGPLQPIWSSTVLTDPNAGLGL